jgi:hypothetical protein
MHNFSVGTKESEQKNSFAGLQMGVLLEQITPNKLHNPCDMIKRLRVESGKV